MNLFEKRFPGDRSTFQVRGLHFGADFVWIAGPCAVEDERGMVQLAETIGPRLDMLRGGVFKPRTSPYSFAGLEGEGLSILTGIGRTLNKPVLVEFLEAEQVDKFAGTVDMIQIGARNMYNYPLLKRAARTGKPILLKRHFAATLDELLYAAEYILREGNEQVVLCERGIRSFEPRYRNCLDLSAVVHLQQITRLPVLVDPSHAAGDGSMVKKLALAALGAGADGLLLEVHPDPISSLSDAAQALTPQEYLNLRAKAEKLRAVLG